MKFILGQKIGLTRRFDKEHQAIPVTIIKAGPCLVTQIKLNAQDGYQAVQIGYGQKKEKRTAKPQREKMKASGWKSNPRWFREFKTEKPETLKIGQEIKVDTFSPGELLKITGISKGKGFQGVVRRHGFHGSPATHGHKDQLRMPGAIGSGGNQRVFKGMRMGGRMGGERVTLSNLEVIEVIPEEDLLLIKGSVPGARNGLLLITNTGEKKKKAPSVVIPPSEKKSKALPPKQEKVKE